MLSERLMASRAALSFRQRVEPADLPELMDESCSYEEFRGCLRDLERVNRLTQGHAPTIEFLERVAARGDLPRPLRILDVGSGGGGMLRRVARWARERRVAVELTGVDLNPYAARAAREFGAEGGASESIRWVSEDVFSYAPAEEIDIVLSSLFTHHLSSPDVARFLAWMERNARVAWFVNDARRSERAVRGFRVLAAVMRWHRFVRHDGPVSLQRAFREDDWLRLVATAGIPREAVSIEEHPMARLCVARIK